MNPEPVSTKPKAPAEAVLLTTKGITASARISFAIMALLFVLIAWLHVGTLLLTVLFGYFALRMFSFDRSKTLGVVIYIIAVVGIGYGLVYFSKRASKTLPTIAQKTIPAVVDYAEQKQIELPFTDYASFKALALKEVNDRIANVGRYARDAALVLAMLIIGLVAALSFFINEKWNVEDEPDAVKDSLYATVARELIIRFETFYSSFARVIGAQIIISAINTALTAIFLIWNGFPYATVIIVLTFLCGLLPIIGNIMSNTLIVGVAFTMPNGPKMALISLIFLVVIHKLEYFLNSKIIGDRIRNPMWLTLVGIVLGEKLMGIPGMILAPVVLHYIKVEASKRKLAETTGKSET
ncbi:MAG TPA: AI-2E family transporter [Verrucomicrobiae bacterium]|nr:AI-2E family transporter [Verrucomicrobiae bacterium]